MSLFWQRLLIAVGVIAVTIVVAKVVDWRISKRSLDPSVATRYRVLRRMSWPRSSSSGALRAARHPPGPHGRRRSARLVRGDRARDRVRQPADDRERRRRDPDRGQRSRCDSATKSRFRASRAWSRRSGSHTPGFAPVRTTDSSCPTRSSPRRRSATRRFGAPRLAEASVEVPSANLRTTVATLGGDGDEVYVTALKGDKAVVKVRRRVSGEAIADREASDLRIALAQRLERSEL